MGTLRVNPSATEQASFANNVVFLIWIALAIYVMLRALGPANDLNKVDAIPSFGGSMQALEGDALVCWVAGLFEGEGTVLISKENHIRVVIHMTDLDVLEFCQKNFGGSLVKQKKQKPHHKESWKWYLTSNKTAYDFLIGILPYLHARRTKKSNGSN